ncbi:MAG: hypothetical protein U0133_04405 [Gemmatimonadales bacterium]
MLLEGGPPGARAERPDVVIEDVNKVPLFWRGRRPALRGDRAAPLRLDDLREASLPSALVWLMERPLPWAYRQAGWHAISEEQDGLVERGCRGSGSR